MSPLERPRLGIVLASTRPGRAGAAVASWIEALARSVDVFDVDLIDLREVGLPFLDEENHPAMRSYAHEHSRAWSARIDAVDAFVMVSPEYNHGFCAPLKNALDFLYFEWHYKPVGLVSYGGVSAGTRSAQMLKGVFDSLRLTPAGENVHLPFVGERIEDGVLVTDALTDDAARRMLAELSRLEPALRPLRDDVRSPAAAG